MEHFILMDGAMVYDALLASAFASSPGPSWVLPIFPREDLRLAGPMLIAHDKVVRGSVEGEELMHICGAFPQRLHFSAIESNSSLEELAAHLLSFAYFADSAGDTYGLRIGDARVVADLPRTLTAEQWNRLTAPMTHWRAADRSGAMKTLPLHEARHARTVEAQALHLTEEQIEMMVEAGEPDALLAHIGKQPTLASAAQTQSRYEAACRCVSYWKASGSTDRGRLIELAKAVFRHGTANRNDDVWMRQRLQEAIEATT